MKSQSKQQLQESIKDHAKESLKTYPRSIRNALKHEISAYLQYKKQKYINEQLIKLKLAKLVDNKISERDLVNLRKINP